MNRRLSVALAALLGTGCLISSAGAQPAPGAPLAPAPAAPVVVNNALNVPDLKLNQNAVPDAAEQQQMAEWVKTLLGFVKTGSPEEQKTARDRLYNYMPHPGQATVSLAFIDAYAKALDDGLVAVLKGKPSLRSKLLVGVIAAKAAERAGDASNPLADVAELLLQEDNEAVVLWGMKTVKFVLPGRLGMGQAMFGGLLNRIVPVASKYPGPVLEEAYASLTLSTLKLKFNPAMFSQKPVTDRVKIVIPQVQALLAKRVSEWNSGKPRSATAEAEATTFLTIPGVWPLQTKDQQKQTLTLTYELLDKATAAFAAAAPGTPERQELTDLIKLAAGAIATIGDFVKDDVLRGAGQDLRKITPPTTNQQVQTWMTSVRDAYNANPIIKSGGTATGGGPQTSTPAVGPAAVAK